MRLSTKGRYAVTAMMELALRGGEQPLALAQIADAQNISSSYLEQLFRKLSKNGLVIGTRGPNGGYRLGREPAEISIADIITSVDENIDSTDCKGKGNCQDGERCLTHELWQELSGMLHKFLTDVTLADYLDRQTIKKIAVGDLR